MHHPLDRIAHTTSLVTSVVEDWLEQEMAQSVHHEGSIQWLIAPWVDAVPQSYISLPYFSLKVYKCHQLIWCQTMQGSHCDSPKSPKTKRGATCSSVVRTFVMVRWVVGLILHGVEPLCYFSFQPVLHDWCNKGCGMCYLLSGMVHIKEPLLLIGKSSLCGGSGIPFSLSEWSLTICLTPHNCK